jgi:rod shape-determining protein MreD
VKAVSVLATVIVAVVLQMTLARFAVGGRWLFDLVLVGVVYAALLWGPVAGMLAGTIGGLLEDMLSAQIIGVGGLAKTVVGFAAGTVGAQFIVTQPSARVLVVAVASLAQRVLILALYALIDQRWSGVPWTAMLGETTLNVLCGWFVFQATEMLPGAIARGRLSRRPKWGPRKW